MTIANLHRVAFHPYAPCRILHGMAKTYLKEWRAHRGFTQDEVVNRLAALDDPGVPTTAASLSRLENGKQIYTQRSMEALAAIYDCEVDELHRPPQSDDDLAVIIRGMDDIKRARAARILRSLEAELAEQARPKPTTDDAQGDSPQVA